MNDPRPSASRKPNRRSNWSTPSIRASRSSGEYGSSLRWAVSSGVTPGSFTAFKLQLRLIFFKKCSKLIRHAEKPLPLLVIKRYRKSAQAINAHATFFAHLEFQAAASLRTHLFLEFGDARHQF